MEFRVLGPLDVSDGATEVRLGGAKQRKLVARLLVDRNRVVSLDSLVETLWPGGLPSDPAHQVQVYVSQIRKALGPHGRALETASPGYRLRTDPDDVDLDRFERLCDDARSAVADGDAARAIALIDEALALWRGPFLQGFEGEDFACSHAVRVEALRSQAEIDRLTMLVGEGEAAALIPELEARVAADPTDERYANLLMRALRHEGRQSDAIAVFHRCRAALAEDLGVDPSRELHELFTSVLRHDEPAAARPPSERGGDATGGAAVGLVSGASRSRLVVGVVLAAFVVSVSAVAMLTRGPFEDEIAVLEPASLGVIDPESGRTVAGLTLPVRPTRVAVGLGAVWITSASSGQLVRVDPDTLSIRQQIDVGPGVGPIAFADSAVWVTNVDDGTVARIDPETNDIVQRVHVGNGPADMTAVGDELWISTRLDAAVVKVDARRGVVVKRIPVGVSPGGLAATQDSLWVADEVSSVVAQVDLVAEAAVSTVHVGSGPGRLSADGDDVWVVNRFDGTVSHIGHAGSVEATTTLGPGVSGIVDVDGVVWVARGDGIDRIDSGTSASAGVVASGAATTDLAFGADRVWVVTEPSLAERSGGTLRIISDSFESLDPAQTDWPEGWRVLDVLNDGLVAYGGPDGRSLVANLAVRIPTPSDGGRTYTFRLRKGVRYSTGEQLGPADVQHSFERVLGQRGYAAPLFSAIVGARSCRETQGRCDLREGIVTAEGSRTVTFHLTHPDPDFIAKLATPAASILPVTVPIDLQVTVPGTGPYEVVEYDAEKQIVLKRRDDFEPWATAAQSGGYAERIVVQMDNPEPASRAVLAGHADWVDVSGDDVSALRRRHGSQIHEYPRPGILAVFLNTKVPPFDDVDVRRALNLAVDRKAAQQTFGGSEHATITCQILPPGTQGFAPYCPYTAEPGPSGRWHAPDLQRAKRLLRGKRRVSVIVWGFDDVADTAEHIAAALRDLGYPAEHRILPLDRFFPMVAAEPDIQAGVFGWFADLPGAFSFVAPTLSCLPFATQMRPTMGTTVILQSIA